MSEGSRPRKQLKPTSFLSSSSSSSFSSHGNKPQTLTLTLLRRTLNPRMARGQPLLKPTLATALAVLALYAFFNAFMSPISLPGPSKLESNLPFETHSSILVPELYDRRRYPAAGDRPAAKIYVYDLPRRFTYGVVESYLLARDPRREVPDDASLKHPGHQHSAEWWLLADLNRPDRTGSSSVDTVADPEEADLFYVPFFSSLSLVVNPIRPAVGNAVVPLYSDEEMQVDLVEWLEGQEYWRRNRGRDHVFICQDPNALYKVIDCVKNGVLLVSDFGRLSSDQGSLVKDVILPYSHRINPFKGEVGVEGRKSLLFFMGNRDDDLGGVFLNVSS